MGIFDLTGPEFLKVYWELFAAALLLALLLPHLLRFPYAETMYRTQLDPFEVAFLKGGRVAAIKAGIVALWHRGLLGIGKLSRTLIRNGDARAADLAPMEAFLLKEIGGTAQVDRIYKLTLPERVLSEQKLRQAGLWLSPVHRECLRLLRLTPALMIFVIGIIKMGVGLSRGKPIGFLFLSSFMALAALVICFLRPVRRSWRGDAVLRALSAEHSALKFTSRRRREDMVPVDAAAERCVVRRGGRGIWQRPGRTALEPPREPSSWSFSGNSSCGRWGWRLRRRGRRLRWRWGRWLWRLRRRRALTSACRGDL